MPAELSSPMPGSPTHEGDIGGHNSFSSPDTGSDTSNSANRTLPSTAGANPGGSGGDLLSRVVHGAHQTIDRLADTAAPHVQKLEEDMTSAGELVSERAGQVLETGEEWAQSVRATVRENPLGAVVAAVAVGMLLARLTR